RLVPAVPQGARSGGSSVPRTGTGGAVLEVLEEKPDSAATIYRLLVHRRGGGDVFQGRPGRVEDGDLVVRRASGFHAVDDLRQLGVDVFAPQEAFSNRVLELADLDALVDRVRDDFAARKDREFQLLLPGTVGPDRGEERPG